MGPEQAGQQHEASVPQFARKTPSMDLGEGEIPHDTSLSSSFCLSRSLLSQHLSIFSSDKQHLTSASSLGLRLMTGNVNAMFIRRLRTEDKPIRVAGRWRRGLP